MFVVSIQHLGSRTNRSICMSAPTTKAVSRGFASACTTMSSSSGSCSFSCLFRSCSGVCCGSSAAGAAGAAAAGRSLGVSFDIAFSNELLARSNAPILSSRTFSARDAARSRRRQRNGSLGEVGACATTTQQEGKHTTQSATIFPQMNLICIHVRLIFLFGY